MELIVIRFSIILAFYILSAFATTDILRLLSDSEVSISSSACFCPKCHQQISLKDQIPIFSYFLNKGVCKTCGNPISKKDLFLEIFLFSGMTIIAFLFDFSWPSFLLNILLFEITKLVFLFLYGIRKKSFIKEFALSLALNLFLFCILAFLYLLQFVV